MNNHPEGLSDGQIEWLRSLPGPAEDRNEDGATHVVITEKDDPRHDLPTELAYRYRPKSDRKTWRMYRTHGGDVLLATLDAQLDRKERETAERARAEVRGFVEQLESEVPGLADIRHRDNYNNLEVNDALLDFAHAMQGNFPALPGEGE